MYNGLVMDVREVAMDEAYDGYGADDFAGGGGGGGAIVDI